MAEKTFCVGDKVVSNTCPALIGKITSFVKNSADDGLAFVQVAGGKNPLLVSLSHWHKVRKESGDV